MLAKYFQKICSSLEINDDPYIVQIIIGCMHLDMTYNTFGIGNKFLGLDDGYDVLTSSISKWPKVIL